MSLKYAVTKAGPNHYVLPKMGNMKVEAHAFLSEDLYDSSEEEVWRQIQASASYEGVIGAYLMPDCHTGYGIPVGGVVVTDGTIIQSGSGYDISCFTADTRVSLVDGRELTFEALVAEYGAGGEFYVYSMTPEGRVTAGRAHSPRKTRLDANLVEVLLDNNEKITCTPDHEFLLRDGSYRKANELESGTSLMPLYRNYKNGYCVVQHPNDNTQEKMYRVSFREIHGYVPTWPNVIHHDLFHTENQQPTKTNDDPRFLVEMDEHDHFLLHSSTARARLDRGEIWGAKAHKLYPDMYSRMASENMSRLHADPGFRERHAKRTAETNKAIRARGGYKKANAAAGQRGKEFLVSYNQSLKGRAMSRANGLKNRGRTIPNSKRQLRLTQLHKKYPSIRCPHCGRMCFGAKGLARHSFLQHNNHKVVAVRNLPQKEDVYCLTVEKYANFALSAGVFVHNCGVLYMKVPGISVSAVKGRYTRERWVKEVEKRVATGVGSSRPVLMPTVNAAKAEEILRYGARALGVSADLCERQYIPIDEKADLRHITKAYEKVIPQIGSVGGGNHFVEMQADVNDGSVWIMVHCGSRGYGWQTANHFFYEGAKVRGLPSNRREESWLKLDEQVGRDYWTHHNSAANFAVANRHMIVHGIREATQEVLNADVEVYYEISHNLVQEETLVLPDGTTKRGFVHRKGATRAFPAGHPDLKGTRWEQTGHPCLIPGSMFDGAAILFPQQGAYASACSVNHGSGRILARGKAKRNLEHKQDAINADMHDVQRDFNGTRIEGIMSNHKKIPLDECRHVYKDLDVVLKVLESENIATVAHRLYPLANIKGAD